MGICGGLVGSKKTEMLKKCCFYHYFLKGQGEPEGVNRTNNQAENGVQEGVGEGLVYFITNIQLQVLLVPSDQY